MTNINYTFEEILNCEMCGETTKDHRLLGQRLNQSMRWSPGKKHGISVSVMRCSCGLVYPQPQPVPSNIQDHYGVPPEDYWLPEYFTIKPGYFAREIDSAKSFLDFKEGMTALDVGSGVGKILNALDSAGFESHGIEPSVPFYERAISQMGVRTDRLKLGMIEDVDYEDEFFDFITFSAVFEHIYHPAIIMEKAVKWLKPNGVIHIEVPSSDYLFTKILNLYYKLIGTTYTPYLSPMHPPYHLYEFSLKSLESLGKRLGLEIVGHYYDVCEINFVPKPFLEPIVRKYMERTNTGVELMVYLKKSDRT